MSDELKSRIHSAIARKQEGASWDFKRQWYDKEHGKNDLLHDIICMSNLLVDEDGIIIIGIDEENDYAVCDVSNDLNRKNTHEMVKFLRDKPFAGGIRPTVYVDSISIDNKTIDVIIVEKSNNVPFYLNENFQQVKAFHIYTRIGDSNTPIDKSADLDKVELLWRKHFGIEKTTLDRLMLYLKDYNHWVSVDGRQSWYYEYAPEYRIEIEDEEYGSAYEYYVFSMAGYNPRYYKLHIKYHATIMATTSIIDLEDGRFITCVPNVHVFGYVPYYYYDTDSINFALHRFFENIADDAEYSIYAFNMWNECVPTIGTRAESEEFFSWIKLQNIPKEPKRKIPPIPSKLRNGENGNKYAEEYKNAMIVNDMLEEYWQERQN